jgi:hypothetical protein
MKAILTLATLLFIVTSAVSSAALFLKEAYVLSAVLHIIAFVSLSLLIKSTGINVLNTETHAQ